MTHVACQSCGEHVPLAEWQRHKAEHFNGTRQSTIEEFFRNGQIAQLESAVGVLQAQCSIAHRLLEGWLNPAMSREVIAAHTQSYLAAHVDPLPSKGG